MVRRTIRRRMTKRRKMTKRRSTRRKTQRGGITDSIEKRRMSLLKKYRKEAKDIMDNNKEENEFGFIKTKSIGHDNKSIDVDEYKYSTGSYGFHPSSIQKGKNTIEREEAEEAEKAAQRKAANMERTRTFEANQKAKRAETLRKKNESLAAKEKTNEEWTEMAATRERKERRSVLRN